MFRTPFPAKPLFLALLLCGLLAALPAAASAETQIGIGDQKPSTFQDQRFLDLGIKYSRFLIPWDVTESRSEIRETDAWLDAARDAGVEPLISFTRSRRAGRGQMLPSVRRYVRDFQRFRRRWPWVRDFTIWNEANLCSRNPTCHAIPRMVRYYKATTKRCKRCRIMPAELLDIRNMARWVKDFEKQLGHAPEYWGLHNYREVNERRLRSTKRLLKVTDAPIWVTETGGIARHTDKPARHFRESIRNAARTTRWIFKRIIPLSPRIQRVYFYNWSVPTNTETWDSAFIGPDGPRPSFRIFENQLHKLRAERRRAHRRAKHRRAKARAHQHRAHSRR
jgi:hypothetical protein